jgi:hypothetical protein
MMLVRRAADWLCGSPCSRWQTRSTVETVSGHTVRAGPVGGSVAFGERNIVGDHNQVAGHGGFLVGAGG